MIRHWRQGLSSILLQGLLVTAVLLAVTSSVHARDFLTPEFRSFGYGNSGAYGSTDEFNGSGPDDNVESKPWRISSGMRISHFVSMELGYQDFGRSPSLSDDGLGPDTAGWSLSGMLSLPLTSTLSPYARLGQMFWEGEQSSLGYLTNSSNSPRNLHYGVGLRVGLAEQLKLNFEYERFEQEQTGFDLGSVNLQLSF